MSGGARLLRAAVVLATAGAALAVPAAPSHAEGCSGSSGVTVVVDFASLGGGSQIGCAPGDPASGVAALRAAGFEPTRTAQQPGYFVCRIDGKPANDPCQRASPADAYWSYWHAAPGGSWSFSGTGPAEYDPRPGMVEGWAFGAGDPPSSGPPARSAATSSPSPRPASSPAASPAASPAPSPAARRSASAATARPAAAAATAPPGTAAVSGSPAAPALPPMSAAATPPLSAAPGPTASEQPPAVAADRPQQPASGTGPVVAGLLVALLAVAGGLQALRRRRGAI